MKVAIRPRYLIGVFIIVNALIFSVVTFLLLEIKKNAVIPLDNKITPIVLPFLPDELKKIDVSSRAYIIYDPKTRTIVSGKNEKLRFVPASSTKIMTATIALEEYKLDDVLIAKGLDEVEGSVMKLREEEAITAENLLFGLMLPSGNDAAHVLASHYPGGKNAFIARMNGKASELELKNTKFIDPAGFSDDNYTTAYDLARLASYALKKPKFSEIVSTKNKIVTDVTGKITHNLSNLNELLGVDGVNGVKTGFTEEALGVLVSSINKDDASYVIVVLGSNDRFFDTKNIINQGVKNITHISY